MLFAILFLSAFDSLFGSEHSLMAVALFFILLGLCLVDFDGRHVVGLSDRCSFFFLILFFYLEQTSIRKRLTIHLSENTVYGDAFL